MFIEDEVREIVDKFITELEKKEHDLGDFHDKVQEIINESKQKFVLKSDKLDKSFGETSVTEEEYHQKFLSLKEEISQEAKKNLNSLLTDLQS